MQSNYSCVKHILNSQRMLTIHSTAMYWVRRALQCIASFIFHLYPLSQPPHKTGISQILKTEGTKAQRLPCLLMVTQMMAKLEFEPRTEWVNSYALLISSTLLFKAYSMNEIVKSKCKIKFIKEKETCQRVTEKTNRKKLLRKAIKSQVEA